MVSRVFLDAGDIALDIMDVENRCNQLITKLQERGAPILETPRSTRAHAIADAVDLLMLRGIVAVSDGKFKAAPGEAAILNYYANAIGHWL